MSRLAHELRQDQSDHRLLASVYETITVSEVTVHAYIQLVRRSTCGADASEPVSYSASLSALPSTTLCKPSEKGSMFRLIDCRTECNKLPKPDAWLFAAALGALCACKPSCVGSARTPALLDDIVAGVA